MARPGILRKVRGLEGMLRVRKRLEGKGGSCGGQHSGHSSVPGTASWSAAENDSGGQVSASSLVPLRGCVGASAVGRSVSTCNVGGSASWSAGENDSGGKVSARSCVGDGVVAVAGSAPGCDVAGAL